MLCTGSTLRAVDIYIGQAASTLTSRLQRTGDSRHVAAFGFALFTHSVRERNPVKGTLFGARTGARCAAALAFALVSSSVHKCIWVKGTICALFAEHTGVAPDPCAAASGTSGFHDWAPVVLRKYHD